MHKVDVEQWLPQSRCVLTCGLKSFVALGVVAPFERGYASRMQHGRG